MLSSEVSRGSEGSTGSRGEWSRARRARDGALAHAVVGGLLHWRGITRVCDDGRTSTAGTASEATHVLCEVVISAALRAALPVTRSEWHNTTPTAHATTSVATHTATMVAHVLWRGHHGRRSISISTATAISAHRISSRAGTHSWEGAAEARRPALEVGEAAGGAGPISGAGSVLARGKRGQDLGCAVEDAAGGGGDLDGLLVQCAAIHAQALGSLEWG